MAFYAVAATTMYLGIENYYFVEIMGGVALFSEAMLATPQLLKNYKTGSTDGLRFEEARCEEVRGRVGKYFEGEGGGGTKRK